MSNMIYHISQPNINNIINIISNVSSIYTTKLLLMFKLLLIPIITQMVNISVIIVNINIITILLSLQFIMPSVHALESISNFENANIEIESDTIAIIDQHPITSYDHRNMVNLILFAQGIKYDELDQNQKLRIASEAMISLIKDQIGETEAEVYGIKVNDQEVKSFIEKMGSENDMNIEDMKQSLKDHDIDYHLFYKHIASKFIWNELINENLKRRLNVTALEIQDHKISFEKMMISQQHSAIPTSDDTISDDNEEDKKDKKNNEYYSSSATLTHSTPSIAYHNDTSNDNTKILTNVAVSNKMNDEVVANFIYERKYLLSSNQYMNKIMEKHLVTFLK